MKRTFSKIIALIITLMLSITCIACVDFSGNTYKPTLPDSSIVAGSYGLKVNEESGRVADRVEAVAKVERSVVAIKMEYEALKTDGTPTTGTSSGSGVIIDNLDPNDNIFHVLTCYHVIDSKGEITVYAPDTKARNFTDDDYDDKFAFKGKIEDKINQGAITLIGGDRFSDVAVLKLDLSKTQVTKDQIVASVLPAKSYQMRRGESVFAVGNPSGELPMSVADGVISYLDRKAMISDVGEMMLMQIDVQINHGSSGGGLFNYYGELIGITNAGSDTYDALNYAIPYQLTYSNGGGFVEAAEQLIATHYETFNQKNYGYVTGSWELGITIENTNSAPKVTSIIDGSNSYGKLVVNDIITAVNCTQLEYQANISSMSDLANALAYLRSYLRLGDSFTFTVKRGFTEISVAIKLDKQFIFCNTGYGV